MSYESVNDRAARLARERAERQAATQKHFQNAAIETQRRANLLNRYVQWLLTNQFPFTGREQIQVERKVKDGWFSTRIQMEPGHGRQIWEVKKQTPGYYDSENSEQTYTTHWTLTVYPDGTYSDKGLTGSPLSSAEILEAISFMVDQLRQKGIHAAWPYRD